jgi:uncharacterized protein (TIGR02099 family)
MPASLRRRLRLARRGLWYLTAVSLVLLALGAGVMSQLMPLAERHPDRIAEWLSARAGRPVQFDRLQTEWTRRGPLLRLDGLRVGEGADAVSIGAAEILISQYAGLLPGRSFTELRVRHLALTLERGDDGRWQVRGLPGQAQGGDPLGALEGLGELQVIDARLGISAPSLGIETELPEVDVRLQVHGDRVRSGMRARIRRDAAPLHAVLDFDRASGDGRFYAAAKQADLSAWTPLLRLRGASVAGGRGDGEVWARLRAHQVAAVTVEADLEDVRLRGAAFPAEARPGAPPTSAPVVEFARLRSHAHWRVQRGGWRLDVPEMRVQVAGERRPQVLDGLVLAGGARYGLRAERIDAGPLFAVFALSDVLDPGMRRWLVAARPGAVLERVAVVGERAGADGPGEGRMRARATVRGLRFASVGKSPGLSDLAGELRGDGQGLVFAFDPASRTRFDWPTGFGAPHVVGLRGEAIAWREGGGWRVETPALRIDGEGYGADVRGGLWFQGDGTRPRIEIATDLDDALAPVAKRFWTERSLSPALVRWLDTALVAGRVRDGRAVIAGELEDWPFKTQDGAPAKGVFDARATLQDMRVKFSEEWPATADMDAEIAFVGNGFEVGGSAQLAEVGIRGFRAGMPDFAGALEVEAQADADAAKLLGLVRQSPLRKDHDDTLRTLSASGPAAVDFALRLPLHDKAVPPRIEGAVELRGARLAESEWKLAFAGVTGRARYDRNGFTANGLRAVYDRQESRLSLRAGPGHVRDPKQGFEAELEASMSSDDLLQRSPDLAWLRPHARGRSRWTAAIAIPAAASPAAAAGRAGAPVAAQVSRLQLRSDLVGTALALPAPMDKSAAAALPTTLDLQLPLGRGEIALAFGQRLALRARQSPAPGQPQGQTQLGIRAMFGSDRVAEAPPASGLILGGRAGELDALGWIALMEGDGKRELTLRRADVVADRLRLLGADFADTRLGIDPVGGGYAATFEGPALAGTLQLPQGEGGAISGRLQRMHWRAAAGTAAAPAGTASTAADDGIDPARIPAIQLRVDDLRVAGAALGEAQFRSRPTATGMSIEQLQTRAPKQRFDISGEWSGRGAATRTRLQAAVGSEDFGALLADFGVGGRVGGGRGEVRFDAQWPGSPMAFQLGTLDGSMKIDVRDGRLVEVEPGGTGRVIGLLSLAQLPRRLTLDFRDFFNKGFAFNTLGGNVRFAGGSARSDDLAIDGPSARIEIRGSANLRAQTFDQTIEVQPKAGNLLTAVGAIAGGPVGAAVGAVANAVLQKPIGQAAAKNYRVTGPWKDPKVEVIERSQSVRPRPGAG